MRITLATEVFPPKAGGAGWSTRALALALKGAGHDVRVVTTAAGEDNEGGVPVRRIQGVSGPGRRGPMIEAFRSALKKESSGRDVIHAQHSLSALGALALPEADRPRVIVTVRDHWPVCFWSTRMSRGGLCPECTTVGMWRCIEGRLPKVVAPVAIPYMKRDLALKRGSLNRADAVIAVSEAIADELRAVGIPRVTALPNIVDAAEVNRIAGEKPTLALPERFVLFVGKLEANKGARDLVPAVRKAGVRIPLVVLGSGSEEPLIRESAAKEGIELVMPGWAERADVLRAMKRATALVFPSTWPEPFSRVLLEALALGTPIAAMNTGGTAELIEDGISGLLAETVDALGASLGRIVHDSSVRDKVVEGAMERARAFSPEVLIPKYEALYRRVA